ncbi:MAG: prepilin-type N-terminal cleavage/methylation domain-containing protein [Candidatus Saccharimonadales bacterium]
MSRIATRRKQAGDTIVEVLIAIAIVSLVLAGAYAATNRNLLTTQDTLEHSQALQLVQAQLEFLRKNNIATGANNCFTTGGVPAVDNGVPGNDPCIVTADGIMAAANVQPSFTLHITGNMSTVYVVSAVWPGLNGANDNVTMYYRP